MAVDPCDLVSFVCWQAVCRNEGDPYDPTLGEATQPRRIHRKLGVATCRKGWGGAGVCMYPVAEHAATHIEYALDVFGLETDRIGIVMDLQYGEALHAPVISYNVRVVEEPREDYRIDLDYSFEEVDLEIVLTDIYPECVRTIKARFPDAQLQYQRLVNGE